MLLKHTPAQCLEPPISQKHTPAQCLHLSEIITFLKKLQNARLRSVLDGFIWFYVVLGGFHVFQPPEVREPGAACGSLWQPVAASCDP